MAAMAHLHQQHVSPAIDGHTPGSWVSIRHSLAHDRLAVSCPDGDWSDRRQRILCLARDRRQPPAAPGSASGRHHVAVAFRKRQRPERGCCCLQFRSFIADTLSSALRALPGFANLHRPADAEHHCGLSGSAGRSCGNRRGEACAGAARTGGSRGLRADECLFDAHDRCVAGTLACQSPLSRDLQRADGADRHWISVPELSARSGARPRRQKQHGSKSSAQLRNGPALAASGLRRQCDPSTRTSN